MPIATVKQLCTPSEIVKSDSLVQQVAQIEDFASGRIDGQAFFRRNVFTAGLELLVRRGFDRLAGKSDDGAFYLTQAMGGGKTHSLIAFGLLAADPAQHREQGRFRALAGKTWNHPVIAHGRLYLRNDEEMTCFELPGFQQKKQFAR